MEKVAVRRWKEHYDRSRMHSKSPEREDPETKKFSRVMSKSLSPPRMRKAVLAAKRREEKLSLMGQRNPSLTLPTDDVPVLEEVAGNGMKTIRVKTERVSEIDPETNKMVHRQVTTKTRMRPEIPNLERQASVDIMTKFDERLSFCEQALRQDKLKLSALDPINMSKVKEDSAKQKARMNFDTNCETKFTFGLSDYAAKLQEGPNAKENPLLQLIDIVQQPNLMSKLQSDKIAIAEEDFRVEEIQDATTLASLKAEIDELNKKITSSSSNFAIQEQIEELKGNMYDIMKKKRERERVAAEQQYIMGSPKLAIVYNTLQTKLIEVFLACKVVGSGMVDHGIGKTASRTIGVVEIVSECIEVIPFVPAEVIAHIFRIGVTEHLEKKNMKKAKKMDDEMGVSISKMEKTVEAAARAVVLRYEEQILCLSKEGAKKMAECAVARQLHHMRHSRVPSGSTDALVQGLVECLLLEQKSLLPKTSTKLKLCKKKRSIKGEPKFWSENSTFTKPGVITSTGERFVAKGMVPEKYGYRFGTLAEASSKCLEKVGDVETKPVVYDSEQGMLAYPKPPQGESGSAPTMLEAQLAIAPPSPPSSRNSEVFTGLPTNAYLAQAEPGLSLDDYEEQISTLRFEFEQHKRDTDAQMRAMQQQIFQLMELVTPSTLLSANPAPVKEEVSLPVPQQSKRMFLQKVTSFQVSARRHGLTEEDLRRAIEKFHEYDRLSSNDGSIPRDKLISLMRTIFHGSISERVLTSAMDIHLAEIPQTEEGNINLDSFLKLYRKLARTPAN